MVQAEDNFVKILFRFFSNVLDEWAVETMWAEIIDKAKGYYKLDNIPFYAPVASNDIVFAEYDDSELMLTYRKTIEPSGNSTIQIIIMDSATDINAIRKIFDDLGCVSEKFNDSYFVMEIPVENSYVPIKQKLEELEDKGIIGYAEPCLSYKHQ